MKLEETLPFVGKSEKVNIVSDLFPSSWCNGWVVLWRRLVLPQENNVNELFEILLIFQPNLKVYTVKVL